MAGLDMAGRGAAWGIYDIDNYLAHGGKLPDLRLFSEEQMAIIERLPWSDEQRARRSRCQFLSAPRGGGRRRRARRRHAHGGRGSKNLG
jgi:hypothetical protein